MYNDDEKQILDEELSTDISAILKHGFGEVRLIIRDGVLKDSEVTKRRRHNLNQADNGR